MVPNSSTVGTVPQLGALEVVSRDSPVLSLLTDSKALLMSRKKRKAKMLYSPPNPCHCKIGILVHFKGFINVLLDNTNPSLQKEKWRDNPLRHRRAHSWAH